MMCVMMEPEIWPAVTLGGSLRLSGESTSYGVLSDGADVAMCGMHTCMMARTPLPSHATYGQEQVMLTTCERRDGNARHAA